jgi:hypothetical protein
MFKNTVRNRSDNIAPEQGFLFALLFFRRRPPSRGSGRSRRSLLHLLRSRLRSGFSRRWSWCSRLFGSWRFLWPALLLSLRFLRRPALLFSPRLLNCSTRFLGLWPLLSGPALLLGRRSLRRRLTLLFGPRRLTGRRSAAFGFRSFLFIGSRLGFSRLLGRLRLLRLGLLIGLWWLTGFRLRRFPGCRLLIGFCRDGRP